MQPSVALSALQFIFAYDEHVEKFRKTQFQAHIWGPQYVRVEARVDLALTFNHE